MAKQLRGAASVILSAITADSRQVPMNFGRSFQIGRNFAWVWEAGIGDLMGVEPVLNSVSCAFSQGRATVFTALLQESGLVPAVETHILFTPPHFQVTDLLTGSTFAIVQFGAITAQQTVINRAVTISDNFNGEAQWAYFRDELERGQTQ